MFLKYLIQAFDIHFKVNLEPLRLDFNEEKLPKL